MSASVCRTESCRCAATSARSCERIRSARSIDSDVSSRTKNGAKITTSAIATTSAASATSDAAASAPLICRNTIAAVITSVTPIPIREMTAGRESPWSSNSGSGASAPGVAPAVATAVATAVAPGVPGRPTDWRQISAPPAATSTSGQVSASENGSPSSRNVSRIETTRQPTPMPTSSAARRLRELRCSAAAAAAAGWAPSTGSSHQASR